MNGIIIKLFYFTNDIFGNYAVLKCYTDFIKSKTLTFSFYFSGLIIYFNDIKTSLIISSCSLRLNISF